MDPAVAPAAPKGYLGDPNVEHPIVGSIKTNEKGEVQNFFRIEGPGIGLGTNGAYSPNACSFDRENCIEIKDFTLMGEAVNAGVEIQQATYNRTSTDGGTIDVFASSRRSSTID